MKYLWKFRQKLASFEVFSPKNYPKVFGCRTSKRVKTCYKMLTYSIRPTYSVLIFQILSLPPKETHNPPTHLCWRRNPIKAPSFQDLDVLLSCKQLLHCKTFLREMPEEHKN